MVGGLVDLLDKKRENEEKRKGEATEHTEGQLYEAKYIYDKIEEIIFRDNLQH